VVETFIDAYPKFPRLRWYDVIFAIEIEVFGGGIEVMRYPELFRIG